MKRILGIVGFTLLTMTCLADSASIFSWNYSQILGPASEVDEGVRIEFDHWLKSDAPPEYATFFNARIFSAADIGSTEVVNLASSTSGSSTPETWLDGRESDFHILVDQLTDGINQHTGVVFWRTDGVGQGGGVTEEALFGASSASVNGIDFAGYRIDSLSFTLQSWDSYIFDDSHEGIEVGGTFSIYGEMIPEPTTLTLLGFSTMGLLFRRRKMRRCMLTGESSRRDPFELDPVKKTEEVVGYVNTIKPYMNAKARAKARAEVRWVSY